MRPAPLTAAPVTAAALSTGENSSRVGSVELRPFRFFCRHSNCRRRSAASARRSALKRSRGREGAVVSHWLSAACGGTALFIRGSVLAAASISRLRRNGAHPIYTNSETALSSFSPGFPSPVVHASALRVPASTLCSITNHLRVVPCPGLPLDSQLTGQPAPVSRPVWALFSRRRRTAKHGERQRQLG